jgi:formamidopyrimidine-DNA glycosylase
MSGTMPELPEVETVRRELEPWLTGRTIVRARRASAPPGPKYARLERASGQRIVAVGRRGKFLVLPLDGGDDLVVHLGMTGVITSVRPASHVRAVLELDGEAPSVLYFQDPRRFGRFLTVPSGDYRSLPTLHHLGPEPLDPSFRPRAFHEALAHSRAPIKALLLGQRPVAGVGNIYADEALWRARIHPRVPAGELTRAQAAALLRAIRAVLARSIELQGTTFRDYRTVNGQPGAFVAELAAYGHEGDPCRRCRAPLRKIVVGGRGTCFCPGCQKGPR